MLNRSWFPTAAWTLLVVLHGAFTLYVFLGDSFRGKVLSLNIPEIIALAFIATLAMMAKYSERQAHRDEAFAYVMTALVFIFVGAIAIRLAEEKTAGAAVAAGLFATLGWLFTNYNTSRNQRIAHTITTLLGMRNSVEYMKSRKVVFDAFPTEEVIPKDRAMTLAGSSVPQSATDSELGASLTYMLNYLEFISVNVLRGNLNDETVYRSMGGIIVNIYIFAQPYIVYGREDDWGFKNPALYVELEQLAREYALRKHRKIPAFKIERAAKPEDVTESPLRPEV